VHGHEGEESRGFREFREFREKLKNGVLRRKGGLRRLFL
jgi:hypothetical protein